MCIRDRSGITKERLRDIYCAVTRSILEYSSNVYHSQLNKSQSKQLERIQKRCLKAIYGYDYNYEELLRLANLDTLEERRQKAFEKFTSNTVKNPKYHHWFPNRVISRFTRSTAKYMEESAVGNRLYKSPIFTLRRHLNNTESPEIVNLSQLFS